MSDALDAPVEVPLALLPLRIETRFNPGGASLRVRIWPDDLHVDALGIGLRSGEREAADAYWKKVWADGKAHVDAWAALVERVGAPRAPWVAEQTRPVNWQDRPVGDPELPVLPDATMPGPQARTLPDQLVVQVEQAGGVTRHRIDKPIPDVVSMALLAEDMPGPASLAAGELPVPPSARWMVDYGAAEEIGLAVTVPVTPGVKIDRLTVAGVKGLPPEEAAGRLAEVLRAHRFTQGAAFLAPGTPTNNTDRTRSPWDHSTSPAEVLSQPVPPPSRSDGAVAAAALGLDPLVFAGWPGGDGAHQRRAEAFVSALWATTAESFLVDRLHPSHRGGPLSRGDIADLRAHAVAHLRAGGPLPAIRVGKQPYGVLPAMVTDPQMRAPQDRHVVEARLAPLLHRSRALWRAAVEDVPTVMGGDPERDLADVLGTSPVSVGVRIRTVAEADPLLKWIGAKGYEEDARLQHDANLLTLGLVDVKATAVKADGLLGASDRQLAVPLVNERDGEVATALAKRMDHPGVEVPAPTSLLQILLVHAVKHAAAEQDRAAVGFEVQELRGRLAQAAESLHLDTELLGAALADVSDRDRATEATMVAADYLANTVGLADIQAIHDRPVVPAAGPMSALSVVQSGVIQSETALLQVLGSWFSALSRRTELRDALFEIGQITELEDRRILLAGYLDVCSHRLDAWVTSLATSRLASLRLAAPRGVVLGAYGYVEELVSADARPVQGPVPAGLEGVDLLEERHPGGYVHAPSTTHAATAAILRAGRLSHDWSPTASPALDIDMSSARVRDALHLMSGVRRGQSLGALLGYRFERRLHEAGRPSQGGGPPVELDRFIYVLRALAPLVDAKLTSPAMAEEALAATNVVDGLRLHDLGWAAVEPALGQGPKDKSKLPGGWPPVTAQEATGVRRAFDRLEEDLDGLADVLLAESVHQLVQGNTTRASAALEALGGGEALLPEPDVVRTPRSGTAIRHQVLVTVPDSAEGWNPASTRAVNEPLLEAWASSHLGDRAAWPIGAASLADTDLGALDVVYDADGASVEESTLGWRLRQRFGQDVDLSTLGVLWELARALRSVLVGSRTFTAGIDPVALKARGDVAVKALADALAALDPDPAEVVAELVRQCVPMGTVLRPDPPADLVLAVSRSMTQEAERRVAIAAGHLTAADDALTMVAALGADDPQRDAARTKVVERSVDALHTVMGEGFCVVAPTNAVLRAGEAALSPFDEADVGDGRDIRPWLARMGSVRSPLERYGRALVVREALGGVRRRLRSAQHGWAPWVGARFPPGVAPPDGPVHHLVVESADGTLPDGMIAVGAFVVDSWVEVVPRRVARYDVADDGTKTLRDIVSTTTSGMAVGANGPNARAPQAVLLAVSPDGQRWTTDKVFATILDTAGLAKERAVTLERLPWVGRILPALYFWDWSLQGRPVIDFTRSTKALFDRGSILDYVKE